MLLFPLRAFVPSCETTPGARPPPVDIPAGRPKTTAAMALRVYNTLTKRKDPFEPVTPGRVGIYLCGPTVYKSPHIGHMVGPIVFDAVKRYLTIQGL